MFLVLGALPSDPLTRDFAPDPHWGRDPNPHEAFAPCTCYSSCSKLNSWVDFYALVYHLTSRRLWNSKVHQHDVVVHPQNVMHNINAKISTQIVEGLWMLARKKFCLQSGTIWVLFHCYLSAFQWRQSRKLHVSEQFMKLLSKNYQIWQLCVQYDSVLGQYIIAGKTHLVI